MHYTCCIDIFNLKNNVHTILLQLVSEMASAAGLECAVDPALAAALRNQKTGML